MVDCSSNYAKITEKYNLLRKREKLKRDSLKLDHLKTIYEINPLNGIFLQRLIDIIRELDKSRIFHEPVDPEAVPAYYETIKEPMDLAKMQDKLNRMEYESIDQFEYDFNLMITNCMQFNQKKSFYYNLAYKLRDQVAVMISDAKKLYMKTDAENQQQELKQEQSEVTE